MSETLDDLPHVHRFVPGTAPERGPPLLLRGTGGGEGDLLGRRGRLLQGRQHRRCAPDAGARRARPDAAGAVDPIVPSADAGRLAALLQAGGARVRHEVLPVGHGLSRMDLTVAGARLREREG